MRAHLDLERLQEFIKGVGRSAQGPGRIYLVGGATALLLGLRSQTIDVDLKLDPEPKGVFEAIAFLKDRLLVNVELAAPDDFLPALPGWRERSEFIIRSGQVDFYHYDYYGQALSKILRGHVQDMEDATALVKLGKVEVRLLGDLFRTIESELIRYPSIKPEVFSARLESFVNGNS